MGKKKNALLLTTLAAGAYAYFSKEENREKAQVAFQNMKTKVDSFLTSQKYKKDEDTNIGHPDPHDLDDNEMVSEGAQTSVQYYEQREE